MTIEEKAKRYDEALEKARKLYVYPTTKPFISDLQDLFPELKENDDEKIRKDIITYLSTVDDKELIPYRTWIDWIEKQGKDKNEEEYIDLGLPSGLKWAKGNLKKSGDTCVIGKETDYGDFWSWGNVGDSSSKGGYVSSSGGVMIQEMYDITTGKQLTCNIPVDAAYDVAYKYLGTPWRLPTRTDFKELIVNTDNEWTSINGIYGRKFKKKGDSSVYVFFPASGDCSSSGLNNRGSCGYYWSSTYYSSSYAYSLNFNSSNVNTGNNCRYYGFSIRPVRK